MSGIITKFVLPCVNNKGADLPRIRSLLTTFVIHCLDGMSHVMRKPVFAICEHQRRRSACASVQSDQCLCFPCLDSIIQNFKPLACPINTLWDQCNRNTIIPKTRKRQVKYVMGIPVNSPPINRDSPDFGTISRSPDRL